MWEAFSPELLSCYDMQSVIIHDSVSPLVEKGWEKAAITQIYSYIEPSIKCILLTRTFEMVFVCLITRYNGIDCWMLFKGFRLIKQCLLLAWIYCSAGKGKFTVLTAAVYLSCI